MMIGRLGGRTQADYCVSARDFHEQLIQNYPKMLPSATETLFEV